MSAGFPPATDWRLGLAAPRATAGGEDPGSYEGGGGGFLPLRVGDVAEKSKRKARKANVKILNKKHIESERVRELRVITKGGAFIVNIRPTTLDPKKRVVIVDNQPIGVATSVNKIALLIEEYFKKVRGMEPLYIYPATQHSLF